MSNHSRKLARRRRSSPTAACKYSEKCPIYDPFKAEMLKNLYIRQCCGGDFAKCQRYQICETTGKLAPEDLLPHGKRLSWFH